MDLIQAAAEHLAAARRAGTRGARIPEAYRPGDIPTALQIQARVTSLLDWPIGGWKASAPAGGKVMRAPIYARDIRTGDRSPIKPVDGVAAIEPEIAFVLGRDLAGPAVTANDVLRATEAVAAAVEVLDSRFADYRFTVPDVVADNASAGRYVIGAPVSPVGIDLRLVGVVLEHRGEVVATASGAAALGHPAAAVAWLARALTAVGEGLRAGQVVLSGGLTAAVPLRAGDTLVASVDRLGSVELGCV